MKADVQTPLENHIEAYLAHKRALGKQLQKAESMLHVLDRYLLEHRVAGVSAGGGRGQGHRSEERWSHQITFRATQILVSS